MICQNVPNAAVSAVDSITRLGAFITNDWSVGPIALIPYEAALSMFSKVADSNSATVYRDSKLYRSHGAPRLDRRASVPSNSLDRALMVLQRIEQSRGGLTNSEVSRELGIATSSCSYILSRLEKRGYLSRDSQTGKYRIGLTVLSLAHGVLRDLGFRSLAEPTLYRLVNETGLSASIGVVERGRLVFVDRLESPKFLNSAVDAQECRFSAKSAWNKKSGEQIRGRELRDIGRELPMHSNAPGKVMLAHLPSPEVRNIIDTFGLEQFTQNTIVSEAQLMSELEKTRKRGWAESHEEQYPGVSAIAAPIYGSLGEISAAVSLNGSSRDSIWQSSNDLARLVMGAAREISNRTKLQ